ncbi:MAG: LacI family DNA-binding transcriptional regulator [Pseudomonadota bacterium]
MHRVTAQDVAEAAGVSLATVDRVLNNRKGVRQSTIERVNAAMERLNFVRDQAAADLARSRSYKFTFFVPTGRNAFLSIVEDEIKRVRRSPLAARTDINLRVVPPFEPQPLVEAIEEMGDAVGDGVALVASESQIVRDAISRLRGRGVQVVTLISDVPGSQRQHYVGIDNAAAGRVAASLLKRFIHAPGGDIAVVAGSGTLRDHVERRLGFEQVMRTECPHLNVLPWIEGEDDAAVVERDLSAMLAENDNIVGVYSLGGGNRGVIAALHEAHRPIRAITHELTEHTRAALVSGVLDAVLSQDPAHEVRSAIRVLRAFADNSNIDGSQERIRIEIYVRDNLP